MGIEDLEYIVNGVDIQTVVEYLELIVQCLQGVASMLMFVILFIVIYLLYKLFRIFF